MLNTLFQGIFDTDMTLSLIHILIKKLRIKLIVASMISLFLVLFIIGGIAGVLNYRKIAEDADRILEAVSYTHLDVYKRQGYLYCNPHGI